MGMNGVTSIEVQPEPHFASANRGCQDIRMGLIKKSSAVRQETENMLKDEMRTTKYECAEKIISLSASRGL